MLKKQNLTHPKAAKLATLSKNEISFETLGTRPRLAPMWQQSGTLLFCSCHWRIPCG